MTHLSPSRIVEEMTVSEKVGQMTQASNESIEPRDVADHAIGSVLSGGNGNPSPNSPAVWADMVGGFVEASMGTRLGVPIIYGVDAVHGHSNVRGSTIFPHNIGLGAIADDRLVHRIGQATATEMRATGVDWAFGPTVAVARDIRWGRTYESFGRDPALVANLGAAMVSGLASSTGPLSRVLACPKHFVADGASGWGTVRRNPWNRWWDDWGEAWRIDQGDARISETELREVDLTPYVRALDAGAMSVMASYSSWNGAKMHSHAGLLTDVLKGELGFSGFVVSDWMGIDQIAESYEDCVVAAVNAGIDMVMVPLDWQRFIRVMHEAIGKGRIPMARIDDAVRRILAAKSWLGHGTDSDERPPLDAVGSSEHRQIASRAARRGAVLLKNDRGLPIRDVPHILVGGQAAGDIGLQCGGWTVGWQGGEGPVTDGVTFLEALDQRFDGTVTFDPHHHDDERTWDVGIVCVAEEPYAEGPGDRAVPTVRDADHLVFEDMRRRCRTLILIVYSGRPVVITEMIRQADAAIAAWLPGSEATELPDLVLGRADFEGTLTQPWPRSASDLDPSSAQCLFPLGHGLVGPTTEVVR
jgi:beta-glucosidase